MEKFRDIVMECTNDVCGMRRLGGQRREGSEWFNEEVGRAVAEKRRSSEEWLQRRDRVESISKMGKMYSGRLWIWRRPMILSIDMACGRC